MSYDTVDFKTYIYRLLKQIHPEEGLSGDGLSQINNITRIVLKKIVTVMNRLMLGSKGRKTISTREVQTAIRLCFPGQLAKHAIAEGVKAVLKYNNRELGEKTKDGKRVPISRSKAAGIIFPVTRVENIAMELSTAKRKSGGMAVYLAAALEYIIAEILELAGNITRDNKKVRITPRHMKLAILNDEEISQLLSDVVMSGGVPRSAPLRNK